MSVVAWLIVAVASLTTAIGLLGVTLYAIGQVVQDRFAMLQTLSWIPTEAALALAALALGSALTARLGTWALAAGRGVCRWVTLGGVAAAMAVAVLIALLFGVEHRFGRPAPPRGADTIGIVHWNPRQPNPARRVRVAPMIEQVLSEHPAELIVLTDPGQILQRERARDLDEVGWPVAYSGAFAVLTELPILELRGLVRSDDVDVTLLRVDASSLGVGRSKAGAVAADGDDGGVMSIWLVDLPSDPRRGRMTMARETRAALDAVGAPAPDLVIGDTNLTRRSAALRTMVPGTRNAFQDAGRGRGASYPEPHPFWHIVHVLVGAGWEATDYTLIAIENSQHRVQYAVIRRRPPQSRDGR